MNLRRIANRIATSDEAHRNPPKSYTRRRKSNAIGQGSIKWTREQYLRATGPLVYVFWGKVCSDGTRTALYVGMSKIGLSRPLSRNHHKAELLQQAEMVEFMCCSSSAEAKRLETETIKKLSPVYNLRV